MLRSTTLSDQQAVTQEFGAADGTSEITDAFRLGKKLPDKVPKNRYVDASEYVWNASGIQWRSPRGISALYFEQPMPGLATAHNLRLVQGRWPTKPGEVVLTTGCGHVDANSLHARLGRWDLTVVGRVEQVYQHDLRAFYGAPGTWNTWHLDRDDAALSGMQAQGQIDWTAPDPKKAGAEYDRMTGIGMGRPAQGNGSKTAADKAAAIAGPSVSEIMKDYLPLTLIVMVGAVVSGALAGRLSRRIARPLIDLGLPTRAVGGAVLAAFAGMMVLALVVAAALSSGIAFVGRLVIAPHLTHPMRPWEWPVSVWLFTTAPAVLLGLVASLTILAIGHRRSMRDQRERDRSWMSVLGAAKLGAVSLLAGLLFIALTDGFVALIGAFVFGGLSAGLMAPLGVSRFTRRGGAPDESMAARRLLARTVPQLTGQLVLMTCVAAIVASGLGFSGGVTAMMNRNSSSFPPPGWMQVMMDDGHRKVPAHTLHEFQADLRLGGDLVEFIDARRGPWWTFPDRGSVERVFGKLTGPQAAAFEDGKLKLAAITPEGENQATSPDQLSVPWALKWVRELRHGAVKHNKPYDLMYTGLTPSQERQAWQWFKNKGIEPFAQIHQPPSPMAISSTARWAAIAFALLIAVLSYVMLKGQLGSLRPLLAGMRANGLGARWLRRVMLHMGVTVGVVVLALSAAGVVLSMIMAKLIIKAGFYFAGVPWLALGGILMATFVGTCLGAALAASHLRVTERHV